MYVQSWYIQSCDLCKWTVYKMLNNGLLFLMFVLSILSSSTQAFSKVADMNWTKNPEEAWPYTRHHFELKIVIFLLNRNNYLDNGKEYTFIASGVILDNSRILTSYNPFRQSIDDPKITENILALIPTGYHHKKVDLKIANIVCGRQITDDPILPGDSIWRDKEHSPIHDLMIVRLEEELGIAYASYRLPMFGESLHEGGNFYVGGQSKLSYHNVVKSCPAKITDYIKPEVLILTLGYESKKQMREFDTIHDIEYEAEDVALVDCEEWLPRQWGYFICVANIGNFPGLGSGAALYSGRKLFGIGTFAMFKEDLGILVFTDVRPYEELIEKTCGDEEFT